MFDISFSEIFVIGVIALVVLGPERLPRVAHTLGHLLGRAQRYVNDVKSDIQREMELEELTKLRTSAQEVARSMENTVRAEINQLQEITKSITAASSAAAPEVGVETTPPHDSLTTPAKPGKTVSSIKVESG